MNKYLDDISEYKIVDMLKEKLQESENLKMEIEAILIKRVFIIYSITQERLIITKFQLFSSFLTERIVNGIVGRMGSI